MTQLTYANEPDLAAEEFIDVLKRSTLAQRRPIEQPDIIQGMLSEADVIITARTQDGQLVGISRALSDFHFCTYLSDLAVDEAFQKQGIGKVLIQKTHEAAGLKTTLILLAAPKAKSYYPHIGMTPHDSCWITKPTG
ncbi:MAG TPA: GNAT family N-acetyltransferase [Phycisphaerales bacterium]|nr:GNAT family N-acetyltransferase [Phycisphaerales bacterium]HCD33339.1 GNAT family N-acetyltransferase [Phycisphaerales bacterium]|tara:strand:+ start:223 stop:633 length:411 start_codon:yes stop_codon:yes gene_type:complete